MTRAGILFLFLLCAASMNLFSQEEAIFGKSIHQEESERYSLIFSKADHYDEKGTAFPSDLNKGLFDSKGLKGRVLGWHPYWAASSAYLNYDYDALSHIAYFSYEVDTTTGGYTTIRGWNTTPVIDYAHQKGTKVVLTVTNFGSKNNTALLSHPDRQLTLLNTLIPLLKSRNADGVNFDLETVSLSQRYNLVSFMQLASDMIRAEMPEAEISMATPAVDWSGSWDYKRLSEICDYLIIMGYNYYWSSSSTAGPVAPLAGETQNVSKSVNTYLTAGVAPGKLMLGVPWYGYDWPVVSNTRKATTTGTGTSRTYTAAQSLAAQHTRTFDVATSIPWLSYLSGSQWRQVWYDDSESLLMKYEFTVSKSLAGIGIWAISYEGSYDEVWTTIKTVFSDIEPEVPESTTIISISPNPVPGTSEIKFSLLEKESFSLEIYDTNGRVRKVLADEERDAGVYYEELSTKGLNAGMYFCILKTGNKKISRKIIVIN